MTKLWKEFIDKSMSPKIVFLLLTDSAVWSGEILAKPHVCDIFVRSSYKKIPLKRHEIPWRNSLTLDK